MKFDFTKPKAKQGVVVIRFTQEEDTKLRAIAKKEKTSLANAVRVFVLTALEEYEKQ
jgi:hypothetical protein